MIRIELKSRLIGLIGGLDTDHQSTGKQARADCNAWKNASRGVVSEFLNITVITRLVQNVILIVINSIMPKTIT